VLLLGGGWDAVGMPRPGIVEGDIVPPGSSSPTVRIVEMDISDPSSPRTVRTLVMDGTYVDARLTDGVARIALNSYPVGISWEYPDGSGL
ncbi:MAG: hypothetical protein GWN85_33200, partial [Gemmatimonadetes bacterium]|nr:hypothetical protein [Gemmatimonadota bacterium]NIR40223.1 hypothetical protein [Actinomycetota bacterium]NIS35064.1 hypothetical protein [Actinomycetota bacterium]NIT97891.1 hypothetical protein [Actinomycetota bacterium]NIU69791.1 hypothetical protein [Actinomycetota bacterium]